MKNKNLILLFLSIFIVISTILPSYASATDSSNLISNSECEEPPTPLEPDPIIPTPPTQPGIPLPIDPIYPGPVEPQMTTLSVLTETCQGEETDLEEQIANEQNGDYLENYFQDTYLNDYILANPTVPQNPYDFTVDEENQTAQLFGVDVSSEVNFNTISSPANLDIDNSLIFIDYDSRNTSIEPDVWPFVIPAVVLVSRAVAGRILVRATASSGRTIWVTVRNGNLAGKVHPVTRVKFDSKGFPIFNSQYTIRIPNSYLKSANSTQFNWANNNLYSQTLKNTTVRNKFTTTQLNQLKNGKTPSGYVWHHHQSTGVLQLVNKNIHNKTGHTGGKIIWGTKSF